MLSFCLYESHGKILLLENLLPNEARAIWVKSGATEDDLRTAAARKAFVKTKRLELHPDKTSGSKAKEAKLAEINAAFDVLKNLPDRYFDSSSGDYTHFRNTASRPTNNRPAEDTGWQTDPRGSTSINVQSYADINYFKKRMWELSGKSREVFTVMAYDGHFFRGTVSVYGSEAIYMDMAKAMIVWNGSGNPYNTEAVFVMKEEEPHRLYLIYLKPHFLNKNPIMFDENDFEGMPYNDMRFCRRLPDILREIKGDLNESISES